MRGLHLTADLYQCRCEPRWLTHGDALAAWTQQATHAVGLEVLRESVAPAGEGSGISAAWLLPHSHVCVHTWPEQRSVTIDVYLAGSAGELPAQARNLMDTLVGRFAPEWTEQRSMDRGDDET